MKKRDKRNKSQKKTLKYNKNQAGADNTLKISTNPLIFQRNSVVVGLLAGLTFFYMLGSIADINNISRCYADENDVKILHDFKPNPRNELIAENKASENDTLPGANKNLMAKKVHNELYYEIFPILENTPMEAMASEISKQDRDVAGFIVGIAMKESKFGIYSPKKNGRDCYNYWGYRGKENPTASGYSCFKSPEHAIEVVGNRIEAMVESGAKKPANMISWKCGSTCAGHSPESVRKWIADVGIHYYAITTSNQLVKR